MIRYKKMKEHLEKKSISSEELSEIDFSYDELQFISDFTRPGIKNYTGEAREVFSIFDGNRY